MITKSILALAPLLVATGFVTAAEENAPVYELRTYYAAPGRLDDLNARFRDHTLELFEKHGLQSVGYWTPIDNTDNVLIYLLAFPNAEAREKAWKAFFADPQWKEVKKRSEVNGRLVTKVEAVQLEATDYSMEIKPSVAEKRVFELRTYTALPGNLKHLNARFRDHTVKLFKRHGIDQFGYWCPLDKQPGAGETLVYLLTHDSPEAAKALFGEFMKDPDWKAAAAASKVAAGGPLLVKGGVKSVFMKATDYSPSK
jgi:NIPSNAP protein